MSAAVVVVAVVEGESDLGLGTDPSFIWLSLRCVLVPRDSEVKVTPL